MRPEDMNTINPNGKAYNGNRAAVIVAVITLGAFALALMAGAVSSAFA